METLTHPQLQWILDWIREYPSLTGVVIFLIAMLESLLIVGVIVPGALLMFGIGALIAFDILDFWSSIAWAIAGAIAGDGISFWIGHHYQYHLRSFWPFNKHPAMLQRGERFFRKHGGKSIVFGRFVGPVRAVIPTIAGMMGMRPMRFTIINVLSAVAWAPIYILPGLVFGASLEIASEVAKRLAMLLLIIVTFILAIRWLIRRIYILLYPRTELMAQSTLHWARNHPLLGKGVMALVDPRHPESPVLIIYSLLLLCAAALFFYTLTQLGVPRDFDPMVHSLMQSLRTPWIDQLMVSITMFADTIVISILTILVLMALLWHRNFIAAVHWIAVIAFGSILTRVLKFTYQVARPDSSLFAAPTGFSFPSAHSTMAMLLYGFLAVLITRETSHTNLRRIIYVATAILVTLVAFSRVYLGVHWFTDALAGLFLGLAWVTLVGIAYRRHSSPHMPGTSLVIFCLISILATYSVYHTLTFEREFQRYTIIEQEKEMTSQYWLEKGWQELPVYRSDLGNRKLQPFNFQWAGSLESLRNHLLDKGWKPATPVSFSNTLLWLHPSASLEMMPVLPHVHNGQHEDMTLVLSVKDQKKQYVLRLWPSAYRLLPGEQELWIGIASMQELDQAIYFFSYAVTTSEFMEPMIILQRDLQSLNPKIFQRVSEEKKLIHWDGSVLIGRKP